MRSVHGKLRGLLYRIKCLKAILSLEQLMGVYKSLFESILRYGIIAWGSALEVHIKPLQVIQNRMLKIILNKDPLYSTEMLYREANVMTIR